MLFFSLWSFAAKAQQVGEDTAPAQSHGPMLVEKVEQVQSDASVSGPDAVGEGGQSRIAVQKSARQTDTDFAIRVVPPGQPRPNEDPPCQFCGKLDQQLRQGCARPADAPYADVIYLRQSIDPALPEALRRAIAAARASGDPDQAAQLLTPYLTKGQPRARYAAGLFLALSIYQSGRALASRPGRAAIAAMQNAVPSLQIPPSDLDFIQALAAMELGRDTAALAAAERAVLAEPRFFAAIALALRLHIDRAQRIESRGRALCRQAYDKILTLTVAYFDLGPCPQQAAHMETYLSRGHADPDRVAALQAIRVYLALISRRDDLARRATERFENLDGPACRSGVAGQLRALLP